MKKTILFLITSALAFGQQKGAPAPPAVPEQPTIEARDTAEDNPVFPRKYQIRLTSKPNLTLSVDCVDDGYGGDSRTCIGTVRQPDEKSASFMVSRTGYFGSGDTVAEHIFDPILVPELKTLSKKIAAMDKLYRANYPYRFVDKNGQVWVKGK